jgi:hypothetical protein
MLLRRTAWHAVQQADHAEEFGVRVKTAKEKGTYLLWGMRGGCVARIPDNENVCC